MNRRSLLLGAASLIAAPAIVRAESLMPIFVPKPMAPSVLMPITAQEIELRQIKARLISRITRPPMIVRWGLDPLDSMRASVEYVDTSLEVAQLRIVNSLLEAYPSA